VIVGKRPVVGDANADEKRQRQPCGWRAQQPRRDEHQRREGENHRPDEPRSHRAQQPRDRGEAHRRVERRRREPIDNHGTS
jgi:hypothetical protein